MHKMKVLELATAAHLESLAGLHLWHPDITAGQVQDFCDKFAALIEREVRVDENEVPRMLVDALERVLQCYRDEIGFISSGQNNHATTKANLALAAAKENGL